MNVKEKDLVQRALGLADSVGSKVSEMEGTLDEVDKKAFPLFRLENVYGAFTSASKGNGDNMETKIVSDLPLRFEKKIILSAPASYEVSASAIVAFDREAQV